MLPASEITAMAATAASALPDTCTIQFPGAAIDAITKHATPGFTARATGVPCRLAADRGPTMRPDVADRLMVRQPFIITLPAGQAVALRDQIVIGSRTFEVLDILNGSWEISRRVRGTEVT